MMDRSAKGKLPYITLNGIDVSDSFFAIQYLAEHYGKDLDDHLTVIERAIGRAFLKLVDGSFGWYGIVIFNFLDLIEYIYIYI